MNIGKHFSLKDSVLFLLSEQGMNDLLKVNNII